MKSFAPAYKTIANNANGTVQRISQPTKTIVNNRPTAIAQRKLQNAINLQVRTKTAVLQRWPDDDEVENKVEAQEATPPSRQVRHVYSTARWGFGRWGSPQVAEIHRDMENSRNPLLNKPATACSGWEAGVHENRELAKKPLSGDWRDDYFAKSAVAYAFRPFAAALAGGYFGISNLWRKKRDK